METTQAISIQEEITQAEIDAQWEKDRQFFLDHEKEFEKEYPGLYIAIYKGSVIGTDIRLGDLAGHIYQSLGNIPFFADKPGIKEPIIFDYPLIP